MKCQQKRGSSLQRLAGMAVVLAGLAVPALVRADVVIVESRSPGLNYQSYTWSTGWSDSLLEKSTASGCTPNIGSRYATTGSPWFRVQPTLSTPGGQYKVFVTLPTANSSTNILVGITQTDCSGLPADTVAFRRDPVLANTWVEVGTLTLAAGKTTPTIEFKYKSGFLTNNQRFCADAVRFEEVTSCSVSLNTPPASKTVPEGADATFTVSATGVGTLTYQWTWKGQPVASDPAEPNKLTLTNVQLADSGSKITVTVTDANCSKTSDEVTLTVQPLPQILDQPDDVSVVAGGSAVFIVGATSTLPLTFEWHFQRVGEQTSQVVGGDSPYYTRLNAQPADHGATVWVKVTDSVGGSVESAHALLSVTGFMEQPRSVNVAAGNKAVFEVVAVGPGTLSYAWTVNGNPAGTNSPTLVLNNVQLSTESVPVQVVVTDGASQSVTSATAFLRVVACHEPYYADTDEDEDVDQEDFGALQACMTGEGAGATGLIAGGYCACFDRDAGGGDGDVDGNDREAFEMYATAPNVPAGPALAITQQPQSLNVAKGNTAVFTVAAVGKGPFSYAWFVNATPAGSNSPTLTLENVQLLLTAPAVYVDVRDALQNWVRSDTAILTVVACNTPYADADNDGEAADAEDFGLFQECITGPNLGPIAGGYCACFDRDPAGGDGDIDVADFDLFDRYYTSPLLAITKQPQNTYVAVGNNVIFKVSAVGMDPLSYEWRLQNVATGATGPTLVLANMQMTDANKLVHVVISDGRPSTVQSVRANIWPVQCNEPWADADDDGDVDQNDFGAFQECNTGADLGPIAGGYCACFDREPAGGDGDVDNLDMVEFEKHATSPINTSGL